MSCFPFCTFEGAEQMLSQKQSALRQSPCRTYGSLLTRTVMQAMRANLSREELELLDVEEQMKDQLIAQHRLVERVVASKTAEDGTVKYLTKARDRRQQTYVSARSKPWLWVGIRQYLRVQHSLVLSNELSLV